VAVEVFIRNGVHASARLAASAITWWVANMDHVKPSQRRYPHVIIHMTHLALLEPEVSGMKGSALKGHSGLSGVVGLSCHFYLLCLAFWNL
jgi:hypothetical protein